MTHVVTDACVRCKYTDCVDVCPVDCFKEGPNFLVIDPDECIDCAVCIPECPVSAIYAEEDLPTDQRHFIAINAERLDKASTFDDNLPAFVRTPLEDAPVGAIIKDSLVTNTYSRAHKRKSRWVVDGSRRPGDERDPSSSSPTCLAASVFLVLAMAAQFGWAIKQFDVVKAYMLAAPLFTYYIRYPHCFQEYLVRCPLEEQFDINLFLLRVSKNAYGSEGLALIHI